LTRSAPATSPSQTKQGEVPRLTTSVPSPDPRSSPFRPQTGAQDPPLDAPSTATPDSGDGARVPPPPPTPVNPS
jgi:hypothetical protein